MNIELTDEQYASLNNKAIAAGFADAGTFIKALADESQEDPRSPLTEEELAASVQMLRDSEADMAAGRTRDLREALQDIAVKNGLTIDR